MDDYYGAEWNGDYHDVIRGALNPTHARISNDQVEILIEEATEGMSAEDLEGFWDTISNIGKKIAPVAAQLAPTVLPAAGAALGTFVGGPFGANLGKDLGQMGANALGSAVKGGEPQKAKMPATGSPAPPGAPSSAMQLMNLIQNPAFLQSLMGQVLGPKGCTGVPAPTGNGEIPFGAIMNALSSLTNSAARAQKPSNVTESLDYLKDENGIFTCDPANPDARAARVLELLQSPRLAESAPAWDEPQLEIGTENIFLATIEEA